MSYNGSGVWTANSTGLPVVTATTISSTMFNAFTSDVATGFSTAVCKDGQQVCTSIVPFAQGISTFGVPLAGTTGAGQIGFIQNLSGAVATTVLAKLRDSSSATDFAAVSGGVTNTTAALQAALDAGPTSLPAGTWLVTGVTLSNSLYGVPGESILKTVTDAPIITATSGATISGISFLGDGEDTGKTNQHGISINDEYDVRIFNVSGEGLGGAVVYTTETVDNHEGNSAVGVYAKNCNMCIFADERGEDLTVTNAVAESCNFGTVIQAGNFKGDSLNMNANDIGFDLRTGGNDDHFVITNSSMNHCVAYGIRATDIVNGGTFVNCALYSTNILLTNSKGIHFIGGQLDFVDAYFDGCTGRIVNNLMPHSYANFNHPNYNGNQSFVQYDGNHDLAGKRFPENWGYAIDGGYVKVTQPVGDLTPVLTGNSADIIYGTIAENFTSGNASFTDLFYSTVTGEFSVKGYGSWIPQAKPQILVDIPGGTSSAVYIEVMVNGSRVGLMEGPTLSNGLYSYTYPEPVYASATDKIKFRLTNNSGVTATVKGGTDAVIIFEGM